MEMAGINFGGGGALTIRPFLPKPFPFPIPLFFGPGTVPGPQRLRTLLFLFLLEFLLGFLLLSDFQIPKTFSFLNRS